MTEQRVAMSYLVVVDTILSNVERAKNTGTVSYAANVIGLASPDKLYT